MTLTSSSSIIPAGSSDPGPGGGQAWNRRAAEDGCASTETCGPGHARKFMQLRGSWIDEDDSSGTGDLWAWGEWEAESELLCELHQLGDPGFPGTYGSRTMSDGNTATGACTTPTQVRGCFSAGRAGSSSTRPHLSAHALRRAAAS